VTLGNGGNGIEISNASNNTVGGPNGSQRNVISGNNQNGVLIDGVSAVSNLLANNYVGTDTGGTLSLGNKGDGVWITGASRNTVGGAVLASRNVISGNQGNGIEISSGGNNLVTGNYIGTDETGANKLQGALQGNGLNGIFVNDSSGNTIGGGMPGAGNVISANGQLNVATNNNGVVIASGAANNVLQGNEIGTDLTGTKPLGNTGDGVYARGDAGTGNTIGGTAANQGNIISANVGFGIDLSVAVTEDFNTIGYTRMGMALPNTAGGSAQGVFGPNDKHQ
jgi:titin